MRVPSLAAISMSILASMALAAPTSNLLTWDEAYAKAEALVSKMTLEDKVGLATGKGWEKTLCVGNTHESNSTGFPSLCLEDGPLGVRFGDNVTAGLSGITAAATFDRDLLYKRGSYMGREFYLKGVHMALG